MEKRKLIDEVYENFEQLKKEKLEKAKKKNYYSENPKNLKEENNKLFDELLSLREAVSFVLGSHHERMKHEKNINYLRQIKDEIRLEETKTKITNYLKDSPNMSISQLARNLKMSRQALYKNKELKDLIQNLKKAKAND